MPLGREATARIQRSGPTRSRIDASSHATRRKTVFGGRNQATTFVGLCGPYGWHLFPARVRSIRGMAVRAAFLPAVGGEASAASERCAVSYPCLDRCRGQITGSEEPSQCCSLLGLSSFSCQESGLCCSPVRRKVVVDLEISDLSRILYSSSVLRGRRGKPSSNSHLSTGQADARIGSTVRSPTRVVASSIPMSWARACLRTAEAASYNQSAGEWISTSSSIHRNAPPPRVINRSGSRGPRGHSRRRRPSPLQISSENGVPLPLQVGSRVRYRIARVPTVSGLDLTAASPDLGQLPQHLVLAEPHPYPRNSISGFFQARRR